MMEDRLNGLPKGWVWTKMEEISEINPKFNREGFPDDIEVTFLPMRCVEELTGRIDLSLTNKLSEVIKGYTSFIEGDLLFAKITPCMENGKTAIAHGLKNGIGFGSTEFHVIRPYELLPRKFFFFFLIQEGLRRDAQRNMTGSAGQLRVPVNYMKQIAMPLPPFPEQHRIVARIEELLTRLDAGIEALKKIKAQLKRYRQAALKHAFEGKLTQEWREANKGKIEPASVLLETIKEQRKKEAKGKLKELPPIDTSELPGLPEGWEWTRLGEVSDAIGGNAFKSSDFKERGKYQVIKIGNVKMGFFRLDEKRSFLDDVPPQIIEKYALHCGDLVITLTGTRKKRDYGFVAMVKSESNLLLNQRLAALRFFKPLYPDYFQYALRSDHFQNNFFKHETGNVGQGNVGMNAIVTETISIPPLLEQQQIVAEIESHLSIADNMEKVAKQSLKQSDRLRQSILKRAFEGKLVPQDPTDEPAEKLLERIKEEKAKREAENRSEKNHRNKKSKQMELI